MHDVHMPDPVSNGPVGKQRRAEEVYQRLRGDIFAARLQPGQRLKFAELCATYDTSVGVAREALTRLAAERLVIARDQHGYTVVEFSEPELTDLTAARIQVESLVFRESVLHGNAEWEASVLARHHLLARAPLPTDMGSDAMQNWSQVHEAFHRSLLAGSPSRRLQEIAESLRDEAELYRRWAGSLGHEPDRNLSEEHRALADAALARDADGAAEIMRDHIAHTAQVLLSDGLIYSYNPGES